MLVSDSNLGLILEAWLTQLSQEKFQIGVHERLQAQSLLIQLSVAGELKQYQSLEDILTLVKPLLCTQPDQQRKYTELLKNFVRQQNVEKIKINRVEPNSPQSQKEPWKFPWKLKSWHIVLVGLLIAVIALGILRLLELAVGPSPIERNFLEKDTTPSGSTQGKNSPKEFSFSPDFDQTQSSTPKVPKAPETTEMPKIPEWIHSIRISLMIMGAASLLILIGLFLSHWRRQLYLQGVRTDQEIEEYVLTDPNPVRLEAAPVIMRQASRILRQRQIGEAVSLHVQATLQATLKAGGVMTPRYRTLPKTPEYLALIDQRHPADHHAAVSKALLDALIAQGVAIQILYFEGSPESGCWQLRSDEYGTERFGLISFSELSARYTGHRLLIFSDVMALIDEISGLSRRWAAYLNAFPQRAWFTPMPIASWGRTELVADEQNFLVLPILPESLITAARWFLAGQVELEIDIDCLLQFPSILRDGTLTWIIQQSPPPALQGELLFQLRNYLGAQRFQWLCACSIFPAISPALTLALGRELSTDARDLMLGMTAFGSLPWFRYAFMPFWLRTLLIQQLDTTHEKLFREIIETRLVEALQDGLGTPLLTLAKRKQQLMAWLHHHSGPARDVVLVDFLQYGSQKKLAQRLPESLRKRLFRRGLPVLGITRSVFWLLFSCLFLGFLGFIGELVIYKINIINYDNLWPIPKDLAKEQNVEINAAEEITSSSVKSDPIELGKAKEDVADFRKDINPGVLEGDNKPAHSEMIQPQDKSNAAKRASSSGKSDSPISFKKTELQVDDAQENNNLQNDGLSLRSMDQIRRTPKDGVLLLKQSLFKTGLPSLIKEPRIKVGGAESPNIKFGKIGIANNDDVLKMVIRAIGAGSAAAIFVKTGADFVLISTTILNDQGKKVLGTKLATDSPAYGSAIKGEGFCGEAKIVDFMFDTCYEPIKAGGETIGLYLFAIKK